MTDYPSRMPHWHGARSGTKRWIVLAGLVVLTLAALLRGPSARLFGGARGVERTVTGVGQRRSITLNDGSRVDLSVATTLLHPGEFPRDARTVTLVGEALFTARMDSARPFIVTAANFRVESSGALFAIRAYPGRPAARVAVSEGSVMIRGLGAGDTIGRVIRAGQVARITRDGGFSRQDSADFDRLTAWREGRIVFSGTPLREALAELGRWQDVELRIADSVVANRRVTAEFTTLQTFTEILDAIALGIGAVYRWQGRVVTFRRER